MKKPTKLLIVAALGAVLVLAGCMGRGRGTRSSKGTADSGESAAATEPGGEAAAPAEQSQASQSKYAVTIDSARVTEDYAGKPAVIVTFTFTNNSDDKANFTFATNVEAYQNGVELDTAIVLDSDNNGLNDIKPGASIQTERAFLLNDMSDIEVEVSELLSFNDDLLASKTFTLE